MTDTFAIDVTRIRDEARQHLKQGPVTPSNTMDVDRVITVLNQVIATEMVCYLRYTQNAIVAMGIDREQVADMFRDHAAEELGHFQRVSDRVNQLGGSPDMNPATMKERAITDYSTSADTDLQSMIRENLVAERIVIGAYAEIIRWLGTADPTSRRLLEDILKEEEDHADELNDLFIGLCPHGQITVSLLSGPIEASTPAPLTHWETRAARKEHQSMSAVLVKLDLHSRAPGLNPSLSDVDAARLIGSRPLPDCTEAATAP